MKAQTRLKVLSGSRIKQGDISSKFKYKLDAQRQIQSAEANIELISEDGEKYTTAAPVQNNNVEFNLNHVLPAGMYTLEIEVDGYVFPSDHSAKIEVVENLGEAYDEILHLEKTTLDDKIKKQVSEAQTSAIDLDALAEKLKDKNTEDDLVAIYNLAKI